MSEDLGTIIAKLTADASDLKRGLAEGRQQLASFQSVVESAGARITQVLAFAGVAVGIYEIASALKEFAVAAAQAGARTETLNIAMEQVGKTYGVSAASLKFYVDELKGAGITTQESMTAVTKALTTGIPLDQLKDLATRARDIAVVAGINTSEALNRMMQGIISGEQETLRRLMIQVGGSEEIYKRYAATLGTTAEQLNAVQKTQAMLNEVMRLSAGFAGTAAAADSSVGKQLQSMARFAEEAKNALWALFGPVMGAAVQEMTRAWKDLKTWADANKEALYDWGNQIATWLHSVANAMRSVGEFIVQNRELVKSALEMVIFTKAAGWVISLGAAAYSAGAGLAALATGVKTVQIAMLGWLPTLLAVVGGLAAYGAYQTIKKPASLDQMSSEEAALLGPALVLAAPKESVDKFEGYETPLPGGVLGYKSPEERKAQADKESKAAIDQALRNAPKTLGKGGGAKGGAKETTDNLLASMLAMYKTKREADLQDAQNSLDLLKTANSQKRAELEKDLAAQLIDGETYYQRLQDLQRQETDAAIAMIGQKRQAQQKAYQESLSEVEADPKLSDEAKHIARQKLAAENRKAISKLDTEAAQARLEGETKITDELRRQVELKRQYQDTTAGMNIETAQLLGAITEQEAILQRLNLEWRKNKEAALNAGLAPDNPFFAAGEKNLEAKKGDALYGNYASQITQGLSSLGDALTSGGRDLMQSAHSVFKGLFDTALKPGLEQLKNLLVNGFKSLFGEAGSAMSGAVMGAIGLVGMMLTSGGGKSSFTSSGVQSAVTGHEAVRGIIAGETSLPIAQIGVSLADALIPTNGILSQIESNTRGGGGGGGVGVNVSVGDLVPRVKEAIQQVMEEYFRDVYMQSSRA
jgi:hypothetical protein